MKEMNIALADMLIDLFLDYEQSGAKTNYECEQRYKKYVKFYEKYEQFYNDNQANEFGLVISKRLMENFANGIKPTESELKEQIYHDLKKIGVQVVQYD